MDTKTCPLCSTEKPLSEFALSKVGPKGRHTYCRPCFAAYMSKRRRAADPRTAAVNDSLNAVRCTWESRGLWQCEACGAILPPAAEWYAPQPRLRSGYEHECRPCRMAQRERTPSMMSQRAGWELTDVALNRTEREDLFAFGLARCNICGEVKPISEFVKDKRNTTNGLRAQCKPCMASRSTIDRAKRKYQPHKTACRTYYEEWCTAGCALCGESRWTGLIHAHHRDPAMKEYHINKFVQRGAEMLPLMKRELSKCTPLCANCHALAGRESRNTDASLPFDDLLALVREKYPA